MESTNNQSPATTVRANVNERAFFKSMRHLFDSSFSVMGEMIQNARRAQASKIAVTCDPKARVITISDDGIGIDKFEVLLDLATSGWDSTEIQLSERPFGMGFFSSCYAAARVVVMSKGKRLEINQEDVIEQRTLQVMPLTDSEAASLGEWSTRIELHDVIPELLPKTSGGKAPEDYFRHKLGDLVRGFPLPVSINGVDFLQDSSQQALEAIGVQTSVGFVAIRGVVTDDGLASGLGLPSGSNMHLYLQGLPIENRDRYGRLTQDYVVHLDSSQFIAKMPDRAHLFDAEKQLPVIQKALIELVQNRLVQLKAQLDPQDFVRQCWSLASTFKMTHLFNDVPFIPSSVLYRVTSVAISTDYQDVLSNMHSTVDGQEKLYSYEDLKSGALTAWRDAPRCSMEDHWAATALKVMQGADIRSVEMNKLPDGHWVNDICPSYTDLVFKAEVQEPGENEVSYCWQSSTATIREAKGVTVTVTSKVDPAFHLEHRIESDWVMVPDTNCKSSDEYGDHDYICWVLDGKDGFGDHPVNVLASFTNDSDRYVEEWETDAKRDWDNKIAVLRDHHLSVTVAQVLGREWLQFSESNLGQLAMVRLHKNVAFAGNDTQKYCDPRMESLPVGQELLQQVCSQLQRMSGIAVSAEQLEEALWHAVRPGELVGGELAGSFHHNATLVSPKAD